MPAAGVSNQLARLLSLVEAEVGADAARKGLSDPPPRAPRAETGGMFPQLAPSAPCEVWHHTLRADSRSASCLTRGAQCGCVLDSQVWPCFDQPPLVTPQAAQPAEAIVGADGTRTWLGLAVSKVQAAVRFMSEGSKPSLALAASEDGSLRSASDR